MKDRMRLAVDVDALVTIAPTDAGSERLPSGTAGLWVAQVAGARAVLQLPDGRLACVPIDAVDLDDEASAESSISSIRPIRAARPS